MTDAIVSTEIGIVLYPGAQLAAVHGLTDLLAIASRIGSADPGRPLLRITHWVPVDGGMSCIYGASPGTRPAPGILILPPTLSALPDSATCGLIARWLRAHHEAGGELVTICSGVFLAAGTGLLDGRAVSTHPSCARALIEAFPNVAVDADRKMVEHPGILTAGGFMAWIDVALLLIERLLGDAVRIETARFIRGIDESGRAQSLDGAAARRAHGDAAVHRAQDLVHQRDGARIALDALAAAAGLERRTFLRRFVAATGTTPIEYCRGVRLARARELLEGGPMPLKRIADSLGYADVSAFAKAFRHAFGTPPAAYRKRHGGAVAPPSASASGATAVPPGARAARFEPASPETAMAVWWEPELVR